MDLQMVQAISWDGGLDGSREQPGTGRASDVSKDTMVKIRKEVVDSNTGWDFRQVMDLIYNKTGVRYHEIHVSIGYYTSGVFKPKVQQKRFVNTASIKDKMKFKKE